MRPVAAPSRPLLNESPSRSFKSESPDPGKRKKLLIGIVTAIVPLAIGVFLITRVNKSAMPPPAGTPTPTPKSTPVIVASTAPSVLPASGTWPLPSDPAPPNKSPIVGAPISLGDLDLDPQLLSVVFSDRSVGRALVAQNLLQDQKVRIDRYALDTGKKIDSTDLKLQSTNRFHAFDMPDGVTLLLNSEPDLQLWKFPQDAGGEAPQHIGDVRFGREDPERFLWRALAPAGGDNWIVLVATGHEKTFARLQGYAPQSPIAPDLVQPDEPPQTHIERQRRAKEQQAKPKWSLTISDRFKPRLSPGRKLVAYWAEGGVKFADTATGSLVASLPFAPDRHGYGIAFDDAFTRAAVVWSDASLEYLTVYDLKTGASIVEWPIDADPTTIAVGPRAWLGPDHVLLDDGVVFDVKKGTSIWRYIHEDRISQTAARPDERYWFISTPEDATPKPEGSRPYRRNNELLLAPAVLAAKSLPDEVALAAGANAPPSSASYLPLAGLPIDIQVSFAGPSDPAAAAAMKQRVEKLIAARAVIFGMVPTPGATAKVTVTAAAHPTGRFRNIHAANPLSSSPQGTPTSRVQLQQLGGNVAFSDGTTAKPLVVQGFTISDQSRMGDHIPPGVDIGTYFLDQQWELLEAQIAETKFPAFFPRASATSPVPVPVQSSVLLAKE